MVIAATSKFPGISFRVAGKLTGGVGSTPAIYPPTLSSTCWFDLSTRVRSFDCQLGNSADNSARLAAGGSFTCTLLNTDRKLDRLNSGSSMYGKLQPGSPVWVKLNWAGTSYDIFHGILDESMPRLDMSNASWLEMRGFDRFATWLDSPLQPTTSTGVGRFDKTSARVLRVLYLAGLGISGANFSVISSGEAFMDSTTYGATLGQEITNALVLEGGESRCFMRRDGRIEFWGSNTFREQTRSWVNQRTYSSKSSQLRYSALDFAERRDRTRNQAHVTRAHSTLGFLLKSTTYQNLYGVRSTAFDGVRAASDADARALPDQPIWRRRELPYNVDSVSVQPGRNPSVAWPLLLAQDIMDRVTVKWRTAVNRATNLSGSTYTLSGLVTGWHLSLDWPSQQATYQTLLECAPQLFSSTGSSSWLQVGTAGTNKLGY